MPDADKSESQKVINILFNEAGNPGTNYWDANNINTFLLRKL